MAKFVKPTPEEIAKEEQEAKELNMTIFQYRHFKKFKEYCKQLKMKKLNDGRKKWLEKKKEERKLKNIEKGKEKRRKTFEKKRLKKEKELEKEKLKKKKEKEKVKKKIEKKKKPLGRPKKVGPKINWYKRRKKKRELELKKSLPRKKISWKFKIVACKNGKQIKYIGKYITPEKAYEKINELLGNEIYCPQKYHHSKKLSEIKYEYLILTHKDGNTPMLRNEFGKVVEQKTNSEKWDVYDKFSYQVEETFWVWGFNNKTERKTFKWIYDNILIGGLSSKYDIRRIILYKNKIIFLHDDDFMDLIICKTMDDSIHFYNKLQELIEKDKIKQVFFLGSYNQRGEKKKDIEKKIMELTGWSKTKTQCSTSAFHLKS